MRRAQPFAMTASPSPFAAPPAVAAFLRGLDRRARLLAQVQAGDEAAARRALGATARVFATDARQWPLAEWPRQYWRLLLSTPAMKQAAAGSAATLPGVARLAAPIRAAVLLHLVAALEDDNAAAALGIDVEAYQRRIRDALPRNPLGQPDVDVWRAWRAAAQRALDALPDAAPEDAPPGRAPATARAIDTDGDASTRHRHRLRWLWLGVAVCALALAATFFLHPRGRELLDEWRAPHVKREALPPADAPKARFDPTDPALHPDRALLAAPRELQLARQLPLLAWLAADAADALPADAAPAPAVEDGDIASRLQAWDRLPARTRAMQRGAWAEWQALTEAERATLRMTAVRFDALPADQQALLRSRYAQLPFDAHRGWHLGPQLGRDWPRILALFAQVDAGEREPLLRLLREATPEDIDALARLAQTTPPDARAALRRELLALAPARRAGWLQAQLQR